jgi:hypothetical protein
MLLFTISFMALLNFALGYAVAVHLGYARWPQIKLGRKTTETSPCR